MNFYQPKLSLSFVDGHVSSVDSTTFAANGQKLLRDNFLAWHLWLVIDTPLFPLMEVSILIKLIKKH